MTHATTSSSVLDKVKEIASLAGFNIHQTPGTNSLQLNFDMGGGRSQIVYVAHTGRTGDGKDVVQFVSPCLCVQKGMFKGLSKSLALDLLRRNAALLWGFFALADAGDSEGVMVCANQIVDTMEVEEFRANVNYLAIVADQYEREHGKDLY